MQLKQNSFYLEDQPGIYVLHRPAIKNPRQHAVLICGPAPFEFFRSHWTRNQMGQRLAKLGFDTFCFDYPCSGDSGGESKNFSMEKSLQSLLSLAHYAIADIGSQYLSIVGLRLGANLALKASIELEINTLFLVDPVLDGQAYLDQIKAMQHDLLNDNYYEPPFPDASRGLDEALGYPLVQPFVGELSQLKPDAALAKAHQIVFLTSGEERKQVKDFSNMCSRSEKKPLYIETPDEFHWKDWRYTNIQIMPRTFLKTLEKHFSGGEK